MLTRTELPASFRYAAASYLPGGRQDFPRDPVADAYRSRNTIRVFRRRPAVVEAK